jgi:hypothetical protein
MTTFKVPTAPQVNEVLRRIPTPQLRRAFFENLDNPHWVEALDHEGAFANPPEPEVTDDGQLRDVYWPESDYLTRMATVAPEPVVDVLLKLSKSNNAWVRRAVFAVGGRIPADQAVRLEPLLRAWSSGGFGWRTDPRDMVGMTVNLLRNSKNEFGQWLANELFKPRIGNNDRQQFALIGDHWYERWLPQVVEALPADGLRLGLGWLVTCEKRSRRLTKDMDLTSMARDSVRITGLSHPSMEQALIDAVRDLAVKAVRVDPEAATSLLLDSGMLIARKVALYAVGEVLASGDGDEALRANLATTATQLLSDPQSIDEACRIEYGGLARRIGAGAQDALKALGPMLDDREAADERRIRDWYSDGEVGDRARDDRVEEYLAHWRHRWLSAVGDAALPEALQAQLAELDQRFDPIDSPLVPIPRVTSWTGPNSPITQTEMAAMSPTELVAHLESWRTPDNRWGPEPSHEGQARALAALVTSDPTVVAGIDDLVQRLRPTYLRAILQGWDAALNADLELDWHQVEILIRGVLQHTDESDFPSEGSSFDDDADFRWAKQAAVRLLQGLARKRADIDIPDDTMSAFAELLITTANDEQAWVEYIASGGAGMDPLTLSLNWQWPIRVRGLAYLLARGTETPWHEAARAALEHELARNDTRGASRAVLGESIGRLCEADNDWVRKHAPAWFGTEDASTPAQQIALTTAMAVHHFHPVLVDLLGPGMLAAIRTKAEIASGWNAHSTPLQRIGEWMIDGIVRGKLTLDDDIPSAFFASTPPKVRGDAIGHIAWSFMHAEGVDAEIRDRFAALWDARVQHVRSAPEDHEELGGFYWFVKSGKFDVAWWLPRLKEALELHPPISKERYMIGTDLAAASEVDPRGAFDVLRLLLQAQGDAGFALYDLSQNALPTILARAIESGDEQLAAESTLYMNQLGEQGHLGLQEEVAAARSLDLPARSDID